jgi:hypothetical protein
MNIYDNFTIDLMRREYGKETIILLISCPLLTSLFFILISTFDGRALGSTWNQKNMGCPINVVSKHEHATFVGNFTKRKRPICDQHIYNYL